ncbi:MAG TPA: Hsp33 family molecular chaperone HslO [Candidatus Aquicultoraceae bacterium]|nr:Hsp33 family molecular chaperone HslO [Candidatus Aquicultoraceae bacterium]
MDALWKGITRDEPVLVAALVDTNAVGEARSLHGTCPTATAALGRVLSGALLLSSLLKHGQKVLLQVSGTGPLQSVVAEADWAGNVRGYAKRTRIDRPLRDGKPDVGGAIGEGFLNVIKDLGVREYYRGCVPLQTGEIARDLAYYLNASEQIPAAVSLGGYVDGDDSVRASGGFLIHPLPGTSEEAIAYLERRLAGVRPVSEMVLAGMGPGEIMEEAVGAPVDVRDRKSVSYHCPCTRERVLDSLAALGRREIEDMVRKGETVDVDCRFCRASYEVPVPELRSLLEA